VPLLADAYSEARLDLDTLDKDIRKVTSKLKKAVQQWERNLKVKAELDTRGAEAQLRKYERETRLVKQRIEKDAAELRVKAKVSTSDAAEAGRDARRALNAAFGKDALKVTTKVNADLTDARRAGAAARRATAAGFGRDPLRFTVKADLTEARAAGRRARTSTERGVAGRPVVFEIEADISEFERKVALIEGQLANLVTGKYIVKIDVDYLDAISDIAKVDAAATMLEAKRVKIAVEADTDSATRSAVQARTKVDQAVGPDPVIRFRVDTGELDRRTRRLFAEIGDLTQQVGKVRFDLDERSRERLFRDVERFRARITRSLSRLKARIELEGDASGGLTRLLQLGEQLDGKLLRTRVAVEGARTAENDLNRVVRAIKDPALGRDGNWRIKLRIDGSRAVGALTRDLKAYGVATEKIESLQLADSESRRLKAQKKADLAVARERLKNLRNELRTAASEEATFSRRLSRNRRNRVLLDKRNEARDRRLATALAITDARKRVRAIGDAVRDEARQLRSIDRELFALRRSARVQVAIEGKAKALADLIELRTAAASLRDRVTIRFDQRGGIGPDFTALIARARQFWDSLPLLSAAAARRVRQTWQGDAFNWERQRANARRFFTSLPLLAAAAARRVRRSFAGQNGELIDFTEMGRRAVRFFRSLPLLAASAAQRARKSLSTLKDVAVDVRVRGVAAALRDFATIRLAALAASRNIDITVNVNRRGGLLGAVGRSIAGIVRLVGRGLGAVAGFATKAVSTVASFASNAFGEALGGIQKVGSQIAGTVTDSFAKIAAVASKAFGAVKAALLPIIAVAVTGLVTAIVGAIATIAGPVIASLGALIGAAIAFLGASVLGGLAGLAPAIVIFFDERLKKRVLDLFGGLATEITEVLTPLATGIVEVIVPPFIEAARRLIPAVRDVAGNFVVTISNSLLGLVDTFEPIIREITGPMADGVASIIDTIARFAPTFADIANTVGPPLTDALNAVLEVVLRLGDVFKDDIANAFQLIADLFRVLLPSFETFKGSLTPIIGLLSAIIVSIVDAGRIIREQFGDELKTIFSELVSLTPTFTAIFAASGGIFIAFTRAAINLFKVLRPGIAFVLQGFGLWIGVIGGIQKAFGVLVDVLGDALADLLRWIATAADGLAKVADWIPGMNGSLYRKAATNLRSYADTVGAVGDNTSQWGNEALGTAGKVIELAGAVRTGELGFNSLTTAIDENTDGLGRQRLTAEAYNLQVAAAAARLQSGKITNQQFAETVKALGSATADTSARWEEFAERLAAGEVAGTKASDLIESLRVDIGDFRQFIDEDNFNIREAIKARTDLVLAEQKKSFKLIELEAAGFRPLAALLKELNPEEVEQALKQLGAVGSKAMRDANALAEEAAREGGVSISQALSERNRIIEMEFLKIQAISDLEDQDLFSLANFLGDLEPDQVAAYMTEIATKFEGGFEGINAILAAQDGIATANASGNAVGSAYAAGVGQGLKTKPPNWVDGSAANGGGLFGLAPSTSTAREDGAGAGGEWAGGFTGATTPETLSTGIDGLLTVQQSAVTGWRTAGAAAGTAFAGGMADTLRGAGKLDVSMALIALGNAGDSGVGGWRTAGVEKATVFVDGLTAHLRGAGKLAVFSALNDLSPTGYSSSGWATIGGDLADSLVSGIDAKLRGSGKLALFSALNAMQDGLGISGTGLGDRIADTLVNGITAGIALRVGLLAVTLSAVTAAAVAGAATLAAAAATAVGAAIVLALTAAVVRGLPRVALSFRLALLRALATLPSAATLGGVAVGRAWVLAVAAQILAGAALVRSAGLAVLRALLALLSQWVTAGRLSGQAFGGGAVAGITSQVGRITAAATAAGRAAGAAFANGFAVALTGLRALVVATVTAALSGLGSTAFTQGRQTGSSFADGLGSGMRSGLAGVRAEAVATANAISSSVANALEVRSPSRVMYRLGVQAAEGLARGLDAGRDVVERGAYDLAATLPQQVASAADAAAGGVVSNSTVYNQNYAGDTWNIVNPDPDVIARRLARRAARRRK